MYMMYIRLEVIWFPYRSRTLQIASNPIRCFQEMRNDSRQELEIQP